MVESIICRDYRALSDRAAEIVLDTVRTNPEAVLILPTGSTPVGMYARLRKSEADFSGVSTMNLDEYCDLPAEHPQSYRSFMQKHLFSGVNLQPEKIAFPKWEGNITEQCRRYDAHIEAFPRIDLAILGIGPNGHIGFNEPDDYLIAGTHEVVLANETRAANKRFFAKEAVPERAVTMGIAPIFRAERVLLLAAGEQKCAVVHRALSDKVTPRLPASVLQLHKHVTVLLTEEGS